MGTSPPPSAEASLVSIPVTIHCAKIKIRIEGLGIRWWTKNKPKKKHTEKKKLDPDGGGTSKSQYVEGPAIPT